MRFRILCGIAITEWRLAKRTLTFWVVVILLSMLAWVVLEWPSLPRRSIWVTTAAVTEFLGLLGSFLLIFPITMGWLRDFNTGHDVIWVRGISSDEYFWGKVLGTSLIGLATFLPPILIAGIAAIINFGLYGLSRLVVSTAIILVPTVVISVTIIIFFVMLVRQRLAAFIILIAFRAAVATAVRIQQLANFTLQGVYISSLIGFGPSTSLVLWNRLFYSFLSIVFICAGALLFPHIEPRVSFYSRPRQAVFLSMIVLSLIGSVYCSLKFGEIVEQTSLSKMSPTAITYPPFYSQDYQVSLIANSQSGDLIGKAQLVIIANSAFQEMSLPLNAGLQIQSISSDPNHRVLLQDGKIEIDPPLSVGETISLTIQYGGRLFVESQAYDSFTPLEKRFSSTGGYVGQNTAYFLRDGNWYPFFNTLSPTYLEITVLGEGMTCIDSASEKQSNASGSTFIWAEPSTILLACSSYFHQATWSDIIVLYPEDYKHLLDTVIQPYASTALQMDYRLYSNQPRPLKVAILPLLNRPFYDSTTGMLFLDEEGVEQYGENFNYGETSRSVAYKRWASERMVRVWWCQKYNCYAVPYYLGQRHQPTEENVVAETLLSYLAFRLTEPLDGEEPLTSELEFRANSIFAPELQAFSPYPELGVSPSLFIRLDKLWKLIGQENFWNMVRTYAIKFEGHSQSIDAFEVFIEKTTGASLPPIDQSP